MHSQFIKKFVNDIYLFYNNNVIIIRKNRRVKELFKIFVKHISFTFLIVILIKIIFFSSRKRIIIMVDKLRFSIVNFSFLIDIKKMKSSFF